MSVRTECGRDAELRANVLRVDPKHRGGHEHDEAQRYDDLHDEEAALTFRVEMVRDADQALSSLKLDLRNRDLSQFDAPTRELANRRASNVTPPSAVTRARSGASMWALLRLTSVRAGFQICPRAKTRSARSTASAGRASRGSVHDIVAKMSAWNVCETSSISTTSIMKKPTDTRVGTASGSGRWVTRLDCCAPTLVATRLKTAANVRIGDKASRKPRLRRARR